MMKVYLKKVGPNVFEVTAIILPDPNGPELFVGQRLAVKDVVRLIDDKVEVAKAASASTRARVA